MSVEFQSDFAIFSSFTILGISFVLYLYKIYSRRKKSLKRLNHLCFLLILLSCVLYLINSLISFTYITNVFKNLFPFVMNLLMLISIFISIFLFFDVLVVFNKEDINRLKNNKLNNNKESKVQNKNKYRFSKKKIVKKNLKTKKF